MKLRIYFYGLNFLLGFVSLAVEIIIARSLAPYWGSGTLVWSIVVAVVLLVLAFGYWYGGKLADRYPDEKHLLLFLLPGAALILPLAFLLPDSVLSLGLFFILAALPLFSMGAASPWILRILTNDVAHTGELAGRLFAFSTIGSFLGSILAALLLLPFLGTSNSFLLLAFLLLVYLLLPRPRYLPLLLLLLPLFFISSDSEGDVIWKKESRDQLVRVFEEGKTRTLVLNNPDNVQSTYRPGRILSRGYWDAPLLLQPATEGKKERALILGNGAGTTARILRHFYPRLVLDTVESDKVVSEAAKKFFAFKEDQRLRLYNQDARRFIQNNKKKYDLIFLDVYDSSFIPFQFATREFYQEIKDDLNSEGLFLINVNYSGNKKITKSIAASASSVFPYGALFPIRGESNAILLFSDQPLRQKFLAPVTRENISLAPLPSGGQIWTDDKSQIEILFPF